MISQIKITKAEIIDKISEAYFELTSECKQELSQVSKILFLKKEDTLVKAGEYADKGFFIFKGCTRAYYLKNGKDISDWFAFENDSICSIQSFYLNVPSPHFIEVLEDSILLEISRANMEKLCDQFRDFERLSKVILTKTMLQQQERISSMQFYSAKQKYKNFLAIRPDISQRIPLTHIASYIGITLETLSRIRSLKN